ncbi:hypothetical protein PPH41_42610, partial [Burkholderia gladioli]|nr:hypothetical protein [Burkholderia gladioli]
MQIAIAPRPRATPGGCTAAENAQAVVGAAGLVFVAVSDDGIGPVAASLRFGPLRAATSGFEPSVIRPSRTSRWGAAGARCL